MRPETPYVTESSVGKPSTCMQVPNDGAGKESMANSHPPLAPVRPKGRAGVLVFIAPRRGACFRLARASCGWQLSAVNHS